MVRHWKLGGAERDFWGEKSKNIQHEIVVEIRRRDNIMGETEELYEHKAFALCAF